MFNCFFCAWKHKKTLKTYSEPPVKNQCVSPSEIQEAVKLLTAKSLQKEEIGNPIAESRGETEEQLNNSTREKVTFDDWNKNDLKNTVENNLGGNENGKGEKEEEKGKNDGSDLSAASRLIFCPSNNNSLPNIFEGNLVNSENGRVEKERETSDDSRSDSIASSLILYPPNPNGMLGKVESCSLYYPVEATTMHRVCPKCSGTTSCDENGVNKDLEECNSLDHSKRNVNGGISHCGFVQEEESSESLFSLSIDSRKQASAAEMGEKEVISPLKPVDSLLNSVENLSQKKLAKVKTSSCVSLNPEEEKENINLESILKPKKEESANEIAAETSLSSWLVESEKSFKNENSPSSVGNSSESTRSIKAAGNRPVLEALSSKEFQKHNQSVSPQPTPTCGSDDVPGIGTIGSFWQHTWRVTDVD